MGSPKRGFNPWFETAIFLAIALSTLPVSIVISALIALAMVSAGWRDLAGRETSAAGVMPKA